MSDRVADGKNWNDCTYPVALICTPCRFGGERVWFRGSATGCGRRVVILYSDDCFACRCCHDLVYPSQRETECARAERRAEWLRHRLGWRVGILNGREIKPRGMHAPTYRRLPEAHAHFAARAIAKWVAVLPVDEARLVHEWMA